MTAEPTTETFTEDLYYPAMPLKEVLEVLEVDSDKGLSDNEAKARLQKHGPNAIEKVRGSFWQVYLAPILNWLINIYIISSVVLLLLALFFPGPENQFGQAITWLVIVIINGLVAIFQQFRAQKKLEALEQLSAGEARVVRNGFEMNITPTAIVPGDILILEQGDKIPADARIIGSSNLTTNEASLTGESVPVTKNEKLVSEKGAPLTDLRNMVFFGTFVATGAARVVTTTTGPRTEIGKIQGTLGELNTGDIPLRKKVNLLAKFLGIAAIVLLSVSVLWRLVVQPLMIGEPIDLAADVVAGHLSDGITSAMTIMPINIPLLTTIVLLTGVLAMAKKGVIIRDLSAVESLGRVSVICSDKTGTMTRNSMTVVHCWDTENLYTVTGVGYNPEGEIYKLRADSPSDGTNKAGRSLVSDIAQWKNLYRLALCARINNDAEIHTKELPDQGTVWIPLGDPTDAALLTFFRKTGIGEWQVLERYKIVEEFPFESELKRMSKICHEGDGFVSYVKGATEVLLPRCSHIGNGDKVTNLTKTVAERIRVLTDGYASKGFRVISLAEKRMKSLPHGQNAREDAESKLTYLGFACIVDPPREGVKDAVAACHSAGINVVMITGDASATAKTIAENLGILHANSLVIEGSEIPDLSDEDFSRVNVFARVDPDHKQIIVERYQDQQRVVAMTGDGVNDSLALAMSDAGIAMGITGTDVAKEAADLVITDDSFASIVAGVHEGRGLFSKIRVMIYFYIAINLFESILFFGALFILPFSLLATWQSIYLVVTTHSFPGLALVFDKVSPRAMEEKPRDSEEIITKPMARFMALNVLLMVAGAATVFFITLTGWMNIVPLFEENIAGFYATWIDPGTGLPFVINTRIKAVVMLLTVILLVESTMVLSIRRINMPLSQSLREPGTIRYVPLLGLIYLAHFLLMYVPLAQEILDIVNFQFFFIPLTLYDWIICIICALPAIFGMELYKRYLRNKNVTL
ncbi:MAG: cation-transporting P-type ATPase [Candidatus Thorarchaeota archaeon]|nr:cation-transporting P-type ATPase [Candidatus Thorarchaeota archaeon]